MTDRSRFLGDAARLATLLVRADVPGVVRRPARSTRVSGAVARHSPLPPPPPSPVVVAVDPAPAAPTSAVPGGHGRRSGVPHRVPHIPAIAVPASLPREVPADSPGKSSSPVASSPAAFPLDSSPIELPDDLAEALALGELVSGAPQAIEYEEETTEVKLPPLAGELDAATVAADLVATTSGSSYEEKFEIFVGWLVGATGAMAVFVADTDGLSIEKRMAPEAYVAASATLGQVQDSLRAFVPSPPEGSTTVELDGQNILQLIWTDTALGRLVTGLVLSEPLQAAERGRIRSILRNLLATRRNTHGKPVSE